MGLGVSIKTSPPPPEYPRLCMYAVDSTIQMLYHSDCAIHIDAGDAPPPPGPFLFITDPWRWSTPTYVVRGKVMFSVISVCPQVEGSPKQTSLNRSMWLVEGGGIPCASGSWGVCHWVLGVCVCVCTTPWTPPGHPSPHGQQAGGTHPTGMLSIIFNHKNPIVKLSFRVYLTENSVMMRNHITNRVDLFPQSNLFSRTKGTSNEMIILPVGFPMHVFVNWSVIGGFRDAMDASTRKRSLGQDNIFTSVSHSILVGGGGDLCIQAGGSASYWNSSCFIYMRISGKMTKL